MNAQTWIRIALASASLLSTHGARAAEDVRGTGALPAARDTRALAPAPAPTPAPTLDPVALTVQLEPAYCRTIGTQCLIAGVPAAAGNRNPVRVVLQVLQGAAPVNGLADAQINILNTFTPAGAVGAVQTSCSTCFQPVGNGMYAIFVNPLESGTWRSGSYHVQVQVTVGGVIHRALAQIQIPF